MTDAPLAPLKAEIETGMSKVRRLTAGHGFADITAGATIPFNAAPTAFARGQIGVHPTDNTSFFGFAEATLKQVQAGLGFGVNW